VQTDDQPLARHIERFREMTDEAIRAERAT
jgi:hypothetical protein